MDEIDTVVIGAGVVGLACARALARAGREVVILEQENAFGTATSARNSEVIHAGLYYPTGSLRARLCVRGKALLYAFCVRHGVAHQCCGKLVVACSDDELPRLDAVRAQAAANGVTDLQPLSAGDARALEPALACRGALLSPSTGIVDSHGLMLALLGDAEAHGAMLALKSPVRRGQVVAGGGLELAVGGDAPSTLRARRVVNAAGLRACQLARAIDGLDARHVPQPFYAQGAYFTLAGAAPFSRLIYPVPGQSSHLGVHLTLDLAGQARFGPSFRWVDEVDYRVDAADGAGFAAEVMRYWPGLAERPADALQPGYAGVRPKISGPGEPAADFRLDGPALHGVPGLVNLFGIESPGLTAALAIGEEVAALLA
ncbi:NAD(P)/FAD-dependent oxidoreductase [Ideonella sp.]|uniref:NAD(P)/FAD-dependent oxidoreductase n=1 Tax=Ideonella sp. TaxID=1929293 RepID=UPI002B48D7CE|nr:NAD(P)/FAD-dependent oxidoreductase [Ideonella sp.]HJV70711.1 NAD(P)/FAD-dependent oxidoreductase [Ideonella sp.]